MCMLFVKPADFSMNDDYFLSLWEHNPHGLSAYNLGDGQLFKTMDCDVAYGYLLDNHESELVVHFRFATSGQKTIEQLHGFSICNDDYLLFHNGMLKGFAGNDLVSDTQELAIFFAKKSIDYVIDYLEMNEKTSRFLLVEKDTGKVIQPKCANWNNPTFFDCGKSITFSNSYAIDFELLKLNDEYDTWGYDYQVGDEMLELEYIISTGDKKLLNDFVIVNPEIVADYLMGGW